MRAEIRPGRTLQWLVMTRLAAVALVVSLALAGFIFLKYLLDKPRLRELTLENDLKLIVTALHDDKDPAEWWQYKRYPDHYAFRIFDRRWADRRRLVSQANPGLLPPVDTPRDPTGETAIREGFGVVKGPDDRPQEDHWLLTDHVDLGSHSYWIQLAMIGDPDFRWRYVIQEEMRDHVLVPVVFIIPALTLALGLSIRASLRPLTQVAAQADTLSAALVSGRPLAPLPEAGLPREIRSMVAAVNTMLGELEALFLSQKQFTSDVAHELRTPVAVLLLQASHVEPPSLRSEITTELNAFADLVNQLLRFAQAEDVMAREQHAVDVCAVARATCEDMASMAALQRVALAFDAPSQSVELRGHGALIDIAVRNLVGNAIRYSPPGGTVSITVSPAGDITVDDRGPGVPDAQKELIFERFYHADRRRGGAGIGLALVRRIGRLHGGDATVQDRPGGGARFVLRIAPASNPPLPDQTIEASVI